MKGDLEVFQKLLKSHRQPCHLLFRHREQAARLLEFTRASAVREQGNSSEGRRGGVVSHHAFERMRCVMERFGIPPGERQTCIGHESGGVLEENRDQLPHERVITYGCPERFGIEGRCGIGLGLLGLRSHVRRGLAQRMQVGILFDDGIQVD